jgi:hypothetical protein
MFCVSLILFGMGFYYGNPGTGYQDTQAAWLAFGVSALSAALAFYFINLASSTKNGDEEPSKNESFHTKKKRLTSEESSEFAEISERNWQKYQK